jgi:hypothetical protein
VPQDSACQEYFQARVVCQFVPSVECEMELEMKLALKRSNKTLMSGASHRGCAFSRYVVSSQDKGKEPSGL